MKSLQDPKSSQLDLLNSRQEFNWEDFKVAREFIRSLRLGNQAMYTPLANLLSTVCKSESNVNESLKFLRILRNFIYYIPLENQTTL